MRNTETETSAAHPLIGRKQTGSRCAIIAGTRVRVEDIVRYKQIYLTTVRIREALPHLSTEQIEAALRYYDDHRPELDADMAEEDMQYEEDLKRQRDST